MMRSKSTRTSPLPSLNILDFPKISSTTHKKPLITKLPIENRILSKRPSISISPIVSPDHLLPKQTDKSKYIESPGFQTERNTSEIKLDVNGSYRQRNNDLSQFLLKSSRNLSQEILDINVSYRQKNNDCSPFLIKSSRNLSQEIAQSPSRVIPQESDTSVHIKKLIGKTSFNSYLDISLLNEKLIKQNEAYLNKIKILEERNRRLEGEIITSRNASIVCEKSKDVTFYDDQRTDELDLRRKIETLKKKLNAMKLQFEESDKENKELKQRIKSYSAMQSQTDLGSPRSLTKKQRILNSEDGVLNAANLAQKLGNYHIFDSTLYDKLVSVLKIFSKYKSLYYTLNAVVAAACKVLNCGYARFLLIDPDLKKVYNQSESDKAKTSRILFSTTEVKIIEKKEEASADEEALNKVESTSELEKPFNNEGRGVSCPIFSTSDTEKFWGVIQISNPASSINGSKSVRKKGFTRKDETLLDFYAKIIGFFIDIHYRDWLIKEKDQKFNNYNESVTQMVRSRNLQEFGEAIKVKLIKYFDFENIGILFTNLKDDSIFTFDVQRRQNGQFATLEASRFSSRIGLSSLSINQNIEFVVINDPEKHKEFIPKVDNVAGAAFVKNMVVGLLKDESKNIVGVLHLINKHYSQTITKEDEESIRCVLKLLGLIIANIKDISLAVNLTGKMERAMNDIEKTFNIKVTENEDQIYEDDYE